MKAYLLPIISIFISPLVQAEIITDGTLSNRIDLPGPHFQIEANLGQQHGGNLFHSFQDFNLQSHESATFSGPNSVQNIIGRVTGGNPSTIDGLIRSTIPNADVYFLNPYGILFGPNAQLDVQGGFHASTADYLRLQDGGRFDARTPSNSLLTVAPVAAFGFLTDTPAAIKTQDSQLSLPKGKTFSWIGGGLEFNGSTPLSYDENGYIVASSRLLAESGRLNLASVASRGEVIPTPLGLDLSSATKLGSITSTDTVFSISSDEGNRGIFIRGGQFQATNDLFESNNVTQAGGAVDIQVENMTLDNTIFDVSTWGPGPGGSLNLKVTDTLNVRNYGGFHVHTLDESPQAGKGGNLTLQAGQVNLDTGGDIAATSWGAGQAGTIQLQVSETLNVTEGGYIAATSNNENLNNAGAAGELTIQARQINLNTGGNINSSTWGTGQGGTVQLQVSETLNITEGGYIAANSNNGNLENAGAAGALTIQARNMKITDGSQVGNGTFGTGNGGTVSLKIGDTLTISGQDAAGFNSGVFVSSENNQLEKAGDAGNLVIEARQLILLNGGKIDSGTYGAGDGGSVSLRVTENLNISGQDTKGFSSGIYATSLSGKELGYDGDSPAEGLEFGTAGALNIQAKTIHLTAGGKIATQTSNSGGGDITLNTRNLLHLSEGQITTSVKGGKGNGGNITIEKPQFVALNKGQIKAQADEGHGGNIRIVAEQFIPSTDSLISASSRKGISGDVIINSPENNIGNSLVILGTAPLKAETSGTLCNKRHRGEKPSRFVVTPLAGYLPSPDDDWQSSSFKK